MVEGICFYFGLGCSKEQHFNNISKVNADFH
jgi:hypothetical protein